jgi:Zn-dependent protease
MKCTKCGKEEILPFRCAYCNQYFCSAHRLPEQHDCPAIYLARSPVETSIVESRAGRERSQEWVAARPVREVTSRLRVSYLLRSEALHLTVGTLLVMGVGLSLLGIGIDINVYDIYYIVLISLGFALSFLIHELAHRFVGLRRGYLARFKLNTIGVIVTAVSIFLPIKFVAPGAVVIRGFSSLRDLCIVALAGPLANILLALGILPLSIILSGYSVMVVLGLRTLGLLNAYIALFNLIPLGPLDGLKIFSYSKAYWITLFGLSVALFIIFNYGFFIIIRK